MELTIAIWEDCKRLLTDNQPITCRRLQPFADIKVHVEVFWAFASIWNTDRNTMPRKLKVKRPNVYVSLDR